jgi:hypothetical protein
MRISDKTVWAKDAYEGKIPHIFNRWCNAWNAEMKQFEGDSGPCDFESFYRRVYFPENEVALHLILKDDVRSLQEISTALRASAHYSTRNLGVAVEGIVRRLASYIGVETILAENEKHTGPTPL